jgi:hypothetical protein
MNLLSLFITLPIGGGGGSVTRRFCTPLTWFAEIYISIICLWIHVQNREESMSVDYYTSNYDVRTYIFPYEYIVP